MEGRGSRGRGGSWKRGGRGASDSDGPGGEHRGRGRGGHHRGRGKRDHYRGRGRGGAGRAADFHQRDRGEDDMFEEEEEEDGRAEVFSRRKLESNWDRYEESEKAEADDDDTPARRGTDFAVLLESAGDSFSQFRFAEEKDWEMDPFISTQMSLVSLDLNALAETLQQLPLHQRLGLESELLEVATPAELPAVPAAAKPDVPKTSKFVPPPAAQPDQRVPTAAASSGSVPSVAATKEEEEEADEELEQLLSLQKQVLGAAGESASAAEQEVAAPEKSCEDVKAEVTEKKEEEGVEDAVPPEATKQEMTEEDLEDWLDSMIS